MKPVKARITKGLQKGSLIETCDNSGAKIIRVISFKGAKTVKGRNLSGGVASLITCSVVKGTKDMRKKVVQAIIVRQKKEYRRLDGTRIKFEDNAVVVVKDKKGNPKGTLVKGPVAKEVAERWNAVSKIAGIVV
ncbi:uL14 family ribosomal protein [Candidatus Woesearchaeota archaeon]|nr:uL14 family ribosomal protein [Candidatus Woesearchaeota archaeon]